MGRKGKKGKKGKKQIARNTRMSAKLFQIPKCAEKVNARFFVMGH